MKSDYIFCVMTWGIFSDCYYLLEEVIGSEARPRTRDWQGNLEDAAHWIMDFKYVACDDYMSMEWLRNLESEADKFTFLSAEKYRQSANGLVTDMLSEDEIVLYFYMVLLVLVLEKFPFLLSKKTTQLTEFSSSNVLLELTQLVRNEIDKIDILEIKNLKNAGAQLSQELYTIWENMAISIASTSD